MEKSLKNLFQLKILFNDDLEKYFVNINEYNKYNSLLCDRINEHFKNFQTNLFNVIDNLDDISKDLDFLFRLNSKVNAVKY